MASAREIVPRGGRVLVAAPRTRWAEEGAGRSTLLRPVEDSELRKAPAGIGWLSRDRGKSWPGKLKSRKHEIKSDAPSTEGESGGGRGARRVCVGPSVRVSACLCVRGAGRSTHHLAGGARPLRGRIGNVEASLASSATCWLKHQLGQNKKLLKKNLLKITEIERRRRRLPPPAGPPAPSPAPRPRAQRACVLL